MKRSKKGSGLYDIEMNDIDIDEDFEPPVKNSINI